MEERHFHNRALETLLAETGEPEAPPELLARIMKTVEDRQPPWHFRLRLWLFQPLAVGISPVWLSATIAIALLFFRLGAVHEQPRLASPLIPAPAASPWQQVADAKANYQIARGFLAAGQGDRALPYLQLAAKQDPGAAEITHWQGVAFWMQGDTERERQSYIEAIQRNPEYLPSLLNLGHHYLERGDFRQALQQYDKVLAHDPTEPKALYNRALTLGKLGESAAEKQALADYLTHYRTGKWAFRALEHLQDSGDFTFRAYRVGVTLVILDTRALLGDGQAARRREAKMLTQAVSDLPESELHLVVYHQGDQETARRSALALQHQLLHLLGDEGPVALRVSWFDVPEKVIDGKGQEHELANSLLLFTNPLNSSKRRNST